MGGANLCRAGCLPEDNKGAGGHLEDEEEIEWDNRQRKSGTVGRLAVYHVGDCPREDVVLRGGGSRRHIVVAGVKEGGQAARVGVRAGDRLVSIDGKKDFLGLTADAVSERLEAPTVLVFLGFVGKLQAEVRLTCGDNVCGVSNRHEIATGSSDAPVTLCEERIFNAGIASLFLTVNSAEEVARPDMYAPQMPLFELQHKEAHKLVQKAIERIDVKKDMQKTGTPMFPDQFSQGFATEDGNSPLSQLKLDFMDAATSEAFTPNTNGKVEPELAVMYGVASRTGSRAYSSPGQIAKDSGGLRIV